MLRRMVMCCLASGLLAAGIANAADEKMPREDVVEVPAIVEGMYCDCLPILPDRLAYPALIQQEHRARCLYDDQDHLIALLEQAVRDVKATRALSLRSTVAQYDWDSLASEYDRHFADVAAQHPSWLGGRNRD